MKTNGMNVKSSLGQKIPTIIFYFRSDLLSSTHIKYPAVIFINSIVF